MNTLGTFRHILARLAVGSARWRGRQAALLALGGLLVLALCDSGLLRPLRLLVTDTYLSRVQPTATRPLPSPVLVIDIDDASLALYGQWPWPRLLLARLLDRLAQDRPRAVGLDILMPEPDRLSPERLLEQLPPSLHSILAGLPSNDQRLADSLRTVPVVLGMAEATGNDATAPPPGGRLTPVRLVGAGEIGGATDRIVSHGPLLRNLAMIDRAASGHGLLSVQRDDDGMLRRLPILAQSGGRLVPGFALEMLRLSQSTPVIDAHIQGNSLIQVSVGTVRIPVDGDGNAWAAPLPPRRDRHISARQLLDDSLPVGYFRDALVLVGLSGAGLGAQATMAGGLPLPSTEIHAQMIDAALAGTIPRRPPWLPWLEWLAALGLGGLAIVLLPRHPWQVALILAGTAVIILPVAAGEILRMTGLLPDISLPGLALGLTVPILLGAAIMEADRQRRAMDRSNAEHRQRMQDLSRQLEAERRAAQDRTQFIDMISHEYRTPLSVFSANLDVLEMRDSDGSQAKVIARMRRSIHRLAEIVEIGLGRIRADLAQTTMTLSPLTLADCLDDTVRTACGLHPGRRVDVDDQGDGLILMADGPMVKTAFLNLLDNALKYSAPTQPVQVRLERAGPSACISVTDHGIGIAPDDMDRVFDRFFRTSRTASQPGTGMGLDICRRIIHAHGGTVTLASKIGQGTTATVCLPLAQIAEP